MYPPAAVEFYRSQERLGNLSALAARRVWALLGSGDFDVAWRTVGPRLAALLSGAQLVAATAGAAYASTVLDELNVAADPVAEVVPATLAGVSSSGAPVPELLYTSVIRTREELAAGANMAAAKRSGQQLLDGIMRTQVADAGRDATSLATAVRPTVTGYVRMLNLPSCSRCALLAGRHYKWNQGFKRHPGCDCRHIPCSENIAGDLTTDPGDAIRSGQVTGISKADTQAIADGADIGRVLNARAGMSTAQLPGVGKVKTTTALTRGRGRVKVPIRLRPETLYQQATDRADALRLLRLHGYVR